MFGKRRRPRQIIDPANTAAAPEEDSFLGILDAMRRDDRLVHLTRGMLGDLRVAVLELNDLDPVLRRHVGSIGAEVVEAELERRVQRIARRIDRCQERLSEEAPIGMAGRVVVQTPMRVDWS